MRETRFWRPGAGLAAAVGVFGLMAAPLMGQTTTRGEQAKEGTIIVGPVTPHGFDPDRGEVLQVDAFAVDLADIFRDLGPDAVMWYQHVLTLSNPWFEGRAPQVEGNRRAAEYLEWYMRRAGLEPAFPVYDADGNAVGDEWVSYRQPFNVRNTMQPRTVSGQIFAAAGREMQFGEDFTVFDVSGGRFEGPMTFVGYAIESGDDDYTSFDDDTDLTGRIAVAFRYEPLNAEGTSRWTDRRFTAVSNMQRKINALVERNAAGIIFVDPPGVQDAVTGLMPLGSQRLGPNRDIPIVQMTVEVAERLIGTAMPGETLMGLRTRADEGTVVANMQDRMRVTIGGGVTENMIATDNVGGVLRGRGDLADEWLIIGGHYDHVGYGYHGARPQNRGQLHPGADDNASGTAGVLIMMDRLTKMYAEADEDTPLRSVLFMGFTAEEMGLLGARHYVQNATLTLQQINAMINLDMIGRLRNDTIMLGGVGTANGFLEMITPHLKASGLTVHADPRGTGPSDHAPFFSAGLPVLFFFSGVHAIYHQPGDHGYTINPAGAIAILDCVTPIAWDLVTNEEMLVFTNPAQQRAAVDQQAAREELAAARARAEMARAQALAAQQQAQQQTQGPADDGARDMPSASLGIMPNYDHDQTGVQVDEVFPRTSAAEAGIQRGDLLLRWNDVELTDGQVLMDQLRGARVGDEVLITLRRGESTHRIRVILRGRG